MNKGFKMAKQTKGKIVTFNPTGEYYFTKGLKAYQRKDFYKSKKYLERALELDPGEPMIACQLAIVYTELEGFEKSNELLHTILDEWDEDMIECHYFLANNYAHLGYFKDAYHHANLYLRLDEDGEFAEDTEDLLDILRFEAEDIEEELYEQDDLIIMQEEASELLEAKEFEKAIELLNTVIEQFPEYWSAYNNLALAYFYLGETERAEAILKEVLEKNPGNLQAICNKTVFAYYQKDIQTVKHLKQVLLKVKPMLVEQQLKLGTTLALTKEYELAFHWLNKLYKKGFQGKSPFYYWHSIAAYYTGRQKTAEKSWQHLVQMNPDREGQEPWKLN